MRKSLFLKMWVLLTASVFLVSCIDDDVDHIGFGDAFVVVKKSGDSVVKGLGLHAFSYSDFASVSVATPVSGADTIRMETYENYKQEFFWETPAEQFGTTQPQAGDYVFSAVFKDGKKLVFSNKLTSGSILPPVIKRIEYVISGDKVDAEWEKVVDADAYNVRLVDEEGKALFISSELNSFSTNYSFGKNNNGWLTSTYPTNGQHLTVIVSAFLLESDSSGGRIQAIPRAEGGIVRGN